MFSRTKAMSPRSVLTWTLATLQASVLAFLLSSCVVAAGNRTVPGPQQTLGRQLVDLKEARDTGAMSEGEYQQKRRELMEKGS